MFLFRKIRRRLEIQPRKIDERDIFEKIEPGNVEPITEGTVTIVRSHNEIK